MGRFFTASFGVLSDISYREHHDPRAERLRKAESLDRLESNTEADGKPHKVVLISEETPEDEYIAKEHYIIHTSSFKALSDSDRDILTGFINAGDNARELARRLGKDPSGVLKLVKRTAKSKKIPDPMSTFRSGLSEQEGVRMLPRRNGGGKDGQVQSQSESTQGRRKHTCPA